MVYLRSKESPHMTYGSPSLSHADASSAVLAELADLATTAPRKGDKPIYVKISHVEHGAFLALELYGFAVLLATGSTVEWGNAPLLESKPAAMGIVAPQSCSETEPFVHAVVINHPVEMQIKNTVAMLAMVLGRQEFVDTFDADKFASLEAMASKIDSRTVVEIEDLLRGVGWREAVEMVRIRSLSAGRPLVVTYSTTLLSSDQIALRAPILRRVYNKIPEVRDAVDRVVTLLSQGFYVTGSGPESIAAFARDSHDLWNSKTYLAHLARDALVCGNGYLSFGTLPDEDVRLLRPEQVTIVDGRTVRVSAGSTSEVYKKILHERGAEQLGTPYGVSALEPFVQHLMEYEGYENLLTTAQAWLGDSRVPEEIRERSVLHEKVALQAMSRIKGNIAKVLGAPSNLSVTVPRDLYFEGFEQMEPQAAGVLIDSTTRVGSTPHRES